MNCFYQTRRWGILSRWKMLSRSDVSNVLALVSSLQGIHEQNAFFRALFERLEVMLNSSSIVFVPYDRKKGAFCFEGHYAHHMASTLLMEYITYYHLMDPFVYSGWARGDGSCAAMYEDFISREELEKTEFMKKFLSRVPLKDCLVIKMLYQGNLMGVIAVHRREGNGYFGEREREIAEVLCDHLSEKLNHVLTWDQCNDSSGSEIGVLIIDSCCNPLYSNGVARKVMSDISEDPARRLFQVAQTGGTATFRTGFGSFRVRSFPIRTISDVFCETKIANDVLGRQVKEAFVVLLEPFTTSKTIEKSLARSGLTVRQQTVVSKLVQGFSNREIARELLISEQTVKDHLHDIFEKLRVRNRCELVLFFTENS